MDFLRVMPLGKMEPSIKIPSGTRIIRMISTFGQDGEALHSAVQRPELQYPLQRCVMG